MSAPALPVPRIVPRGVAELERRARALAAGLEDADGAEAGAAAVPVVTFRLRGADCAAPTSVVERAVSRLAGVIPVPLAEGGERAVAFVEDRPLPVLDLAGLAAGAPRPAGELNGQPALLVTTFEGVVAVAVEGPLELAEEAVVATAVVDDDDPHRIRIAGRLGGGAQLLDAQWLVAWAGRSILS